MEIRITAYDSSRHDAQAVARLIYHADPRLMRFVFGPESSAVPAIAKLVGMRHNDYAGARVTCAEQNGEVVGIIAAISAAEKREAAAHVGREWVAALGVLGMVRAMRWGPKLEGVATTELADDETYVSALAVDERLRGEGVGTRLLRDVLDRQPVVVTDVNVGNADALRFYQRHGFEIQREMTFTYRGETLGNYQLERSGEPIL
jgi:ribosomal protein S18 acetylase RimI-like enzyme